MDRDRNFYFLEMNTRLQVEHPVTELITGVDLVREQIAVAAGQPLRYRQRDIQPRGWAMECRIYAEDPDQGFLPSPGKLLSYRLAEGPGVRVDSGAYEGWDVPMEYDPLLAKLSAWGPTRAEAVERLRAAVDECRIRGVKTTLPLFREILRDASFQAGDIDTGWLARFDPEVDPNDPASAAAAFAAAALAGANGAGGKEADVARASKNVWRDRARRGSHRMF